MPEQNEFSVRLPKVAMIFYGLAPERELLLVAGGRPPATEWLREAAKGREVWCADRGIDACRGAGIVPSRLVGDADSAKRWDWAEKNGVEICRFPRAKDLTDTQFALKMIKKERPLPFVVMTGAFGGRLDHAFSNVYSFFGSKLSGCLADSLELALIVRGGESAKLSFSERPKALSLLPLTRRAWGVTLTGTRWPLAAATLMRELPFAVSNEVTEKSVSLAVNSGALLLYVCNDEAGLSG